MLKEGKMARNDVEEFEKMLGMSVKELINKMDSIGLSERDPDTMDIFRKLAEVKEKMT